jgi:RNA polymerase sigma factor (sigma-70 family)
MTAQIDLISPLWTSQAGNGQGPASYTEWMARGPVVEGLENFNRIVLEYQNVVYNQAYRLLDDYQAAEDAAQEAFILAYVKFHTYKGGSLRAWLLRIVTNLCYDELRRRKSSRIVPLEPLDTYGEEIESPDWLADPAETPEEATQSSELRDRIQESIGKLPLKNRTALVLVDVQELDYAEAAAVMGCPIGTVKSRLARARSQIRADLQGAISLADL